MRIFEIILLILAASLLFMWLFRLHSKLWSTAFSLFAILAFTAHAIFEGLRWQMAIAYLLTTILLIMSIIRTYSNYSELRLTWKDISYRVIGIVVLSLAVALPLLLPVPKLPLPTGPYPVGTSTYYIQDPTQSEIYGENQGGPRELMLQLWYPAQSVDNPTYAPYFENVDLAASVVSERIGLPGFFLGHINLVDTHAIANAPLFSEDAPYPVVLFSHGLRGLRIQNTALFEELASHGYVVASVDHTYDSIVTIMPDGRVIIHHRQSVLPDDESPTLAGARLLSVRVRDLETTLDFLRDETGKVSSIFFGGMNFDRIGVVGHSTGGGTAIQYCGVSPDCQAVVALDSWIAPVSGDVVIHSLNQPSMFMNTPEWLYTENKAIGEKFFHEQEPLSYNIAIQGTNHYNFTDIPLLSPLARYLDLAGPINGSRSIQIVNQLTLNFFDQFLRQAPTDMLGDFSESYPEISIEIN